MSISESMSDDFVFKKAINREVTNAVKQWFEENPGEGFLLTVTRFWQEADDIPGTPPGGSTSLIEVYDPLALTEDTSVANKKCWRAKDPGQLRDFIPPIFGAGYAVRVWEEVGKTTEVIPSTNPWLFDYENGILLFQDNQSFSELHLEGYQYLGTKGITHTQLDGVAADQHADTKIRSKVVNEGAIGDDKILVYKSGADEYVFEAKPTGGGTPGDTVVNETAHGQSPAAGSETDYSRKDHTHGTPAHSAHSETTGQTESDHHVKTGDDEVHGLLLYGTFAGRPAAGTQYRFYYATDTKQLFLDSGSVWGECARGETATRLAQLSEKLHASLASVGEDQHHSKTHDLAGAEHNADTLADLNAKVSDATLDDSGDARTPSTHGADKHDHTAWFANITPLGAVLPASGAPAQTKITGTNFTYYVLDFDASSDEKINGEFKLPPNYTVGSDIKIVIQWISTVTTGAVVWAAAVLGRADAEVFDAALGSESSATTTTDATAGKVNTSTITLSSPALSAEDIVVLMIKRDADHASDTMAADARLIMVGITL